MKPSRIFSSIALLALAVQPSITTAQLTTLYQFGAFATDGTAPQGALVQGRDGDFYGTTSSGGTNSFGTVFRISSAGTLSTLYQFGGYSTDGSDPEAALVQGSDGNFYGTTFAGGTNFNGTVFRIATNGTLTTLYQFGSYAIDGAGPQGALVQCSGGYFYGTTFAGGSVGAGTVFRINSAGALTILHHFGSGPTDGVGPEAGLLQATDGNFYGTTDGGGTNFVIIRANGFVGTNYLGTVFRMTPAGTLTILYQFGGVPTDGQNPDGALVQGADGSFYGTTSFGGTNYGAVVTKGITNAPGTVFRITPAGTLTTLYQFDGWDGALPTTGLVQGSDGNFYGTTVLGGGSTNCPEGCGTGFRITTNGILSWLQFSATDGSSPSAAPVQGSDGYFYGTTMFGGTNGDNGTVFKVSVALNPPANQISTVKAAGTNLIVSIPSVAGETYQLQCRNALTTGNWSNIPGASVSNSIGALMTVTNSGGALSQQRFYRFAITP
jgi:uncharacterized repeat protein (TIGR03803 family)